MKKRNEHTINWACFTSSSVQPSKYPFNLCFMQLQAFLRARRLSSVEQGHAGMNCQNQAAHPRCGGRLQCFCWETCTGAGEGSFSYFVPAGPFFLALYNCSLGIQSHWLPQSVSNPSLDDCIQFVILPLSCRIWQFLSLFNSHLPSLN